MPPRLYFDVCIFLSNSLLAAKSSSILCNIIYIIILIRYNLNTYIYNYMILYLSSLLLLFSTITIVFLTCPCVSVKALKDSSKNIVPVNASKSKCSVASLPDCGQFHGSARHWAQAFYVLNGSSPLFCKPTCKCSSF